MLQFSEFIANHPLLFTALGLSLIGLIANELVLVRRGGQRLSPPDAVRMINDKDALVVDLRAVADYKRGHILAAKNVPYAKLDTELSALDKFKRKPIVLCCALGSVATQAGAKFKAAGFEEVYPLAGGINAWQAAGLPITTKKA